MKNETIRHRRLPPPPLFTIRPPPKPAGSLFENFQTVEILNGRCVRPTFDLLNSSSSSSPNLFEQQRESFNWLNLVLLLLAILSVICCIIIAIFIYICLKKLKKEEKQYRNYFMSTSMSLKNVRLDQLNTCRRTSEPHYKCTSTRTGPMHCCDDYHSHQLMSLIEPPSTDRTIQSSSSPTPAITQDADSSPNHQYECIPDYVLTMTRHQHHQSPVIYHQFCQTCPHPYTTIPRSYLLPCDVPPPPSTATTDSSQCTCSSGPPVTITQEESSMPLISLSNNETDKSMIIGWTRRKPTSLSPWGKTS